MKNVTFLLVLMFSLLVGGIFLQIFLSKRKNKRLGLILPLLCLLFSIIPVLSVPMYTSGELTVQQIESDGTVIQENIVEQHKKPIASNGSSVFQVFIIFVVYNIPTAVLLIVYFACRENIKKNSQLEKMNIQDLE